MCRKWVVYYSRMWMGPLLYVATSIFLWKYLGSVFIPSLLTRTIVSVFPPLEDLQMLVAINTNVFYFGVYFLFALYWPRLKSYFWNPFLAGIALWLANVLVLFPLIGRGLLGYKLPQGWMAVSFPLLLSHWIFARGLSHQTRS
jgi:hypothetical protein